MTEENIIDFELAEDTKTLLTENSDVECNDVDLQRKIFNYDDSTLLKVIKTINSPIKIMSVEEIKE